MIHNLHQHGHCLIGYTMSPKCPSSMELVGLFLHISIFYHYSLISFLGHFQAGPVPGYCYLNGGSMRKDTDTSGKCKQGADVEMDCKALDMQL